MLCQLQSRLSGELSVVPPAVGHDLLVLGQNCCELFQIFHWGTQRSRDVAAGKGLSAACVEKHEVELATLDGVQYIISLLFGAELMSEVIAVGENLVAMALPASGSSKPHKKKRTRKTGSSKPKQAKKK